MNKSKPRHLETTEKTAAQFGYDQILVAAVPTLATTTQAITRKEADAPARIMK